MRRTNIFKLNPSKEEEAIMLEWADNCSRMFNEINYNEGSPSLKVRLIGIPMNCITNIRRLLVLAPHSSL
jgi:hypothetical protein